MLRKKRSHCEIYNDLDAEIVNVFRVTRDNGPALKELLRLTPFAREEFNLAYEMSDCPLERARRTIVRSFQGFGSNAVTSLKKGNTGFRGNRNSKRAGDTPANNWKNYADVFELLIDRLRGVVIENREAVEVMAAGDGPDTLHYVDPPYVFDTRADVRHGYKHEMTDTQHRALADFLRSCKGMVVLSGYAGPLYDELYAGWRRVEMLAMAEGGRKRSESLWLSPNVELEAKLL